MRYTATTEDMREYSQIVQTIARVEMETERLQGIKAEAEQRLLAWEKAHGVEETEADEPANADCTPA